MADAKKTAPLIFAEDAKTDVKNVKETVEQAYLKLMDEFDPTRKYAFKVVETVPQRTRPVVDQRTGRPIPTKEHKPLQNLVLTSQIVWNKQRANIRYYDGCESIFVSEQPKEKETIDQLIAQTKKRNFIDGTLVVDGYDKMLLFYLTICGWNVESPFRTQTANGIFKAQDTLKIATEESTKLDMVEEALELAKNAPRTKMLIHAAYLGIATTDYGTGNELTETEIRAKYRKTALTDAQSFLSSYGNTSLEIKYYIDKALSAGIIANKDNPNKANWSKSGNVICDISGLRSPEAIANRLFEFSSTEEGEEFKLQLIAISK